MSELRKQHAESVERLDAAKAETETLTLALMRELAIEVGITQINISSTYLECYDENGEHIIHNGISALEQYIEDWEIWKPEYDTGMWVG
jgi:hypothetical protein